MGDWKAVPCWPMYEVASSGLVRRVETGRVLRPHIERDGYSVVTLSARGARKTMLVHRVVAEAFICPCPDGCQVRHLNGDPSDNTASNLAYGTGRENCADRERHGMTRRGDRHGSAKTTDAQILAALKRARDVGMATAASEIGIGQAALSMVKHGHARKHLKPLISTGEGKP